MLNYINKEPTKLFNSEESVRSKALARLSGCSCPVEYKIQEKKMKGSSTTRKGKYMDISSITMPLGNCNSYILQAISSIVC